jgi:hypothetical protein
VAIGVDYQLVGFLAGDIEAKRVVHDAIGLDLKANYGALLAEFNCQR